MYTRTWTLLGIIAASGVVCAAPLCQAPPNLIVNPGFEDGVYSPSGNPTGWHFESGYGTSVGVWDEAVRHSGRRSVRISANALDDANWLQTVAAPINTPLFLGGWIKSDNIQRVGQPDSPGATVSVLGRWDQPAPTLGTTRWHSVGMSFISDTSPLLVASRLGFWGGMASGTAWYDDLQLVPRVADNPHPRWKILVMIYPQTDFTFTDPAGVTHHVKGETTRAELTTTVEHARIFVERDIPALSSGSMLPTFTVRQAKEPLKSLSRVLDGWWPAQGDVLKDLDPDFDSVIVIWEPRTHDVNTGEFFWIGAAAGLTPSRGMSQTYTTLSVEYAGINGHRNVYKHEWGHSILAYFEAMQVTPLPTVTNHASAGQYVHCKTGQPYVWEDETTDSPIPNSIYSNSAGFTHDYYSGTVARAEDPQTCLGIGATSWAWGGPVTHSGSHPVFTASDRIDALIDQVEGLQTAAMLDRHSALALRSELRAARGFLHVWHGRLTHFGLNLFAQHVRSLVGRGQLLPAAGDLLIDAATSAGLCAG